MSEKRFGVEDEISPEPDRYRLLLEVTDLVARAKSLPAAFEELAPPLLEMTRSEFLNISFFDPDRDVAKTHYWRKDQEGGEMDGLALDEAACGWAWNYQEPLAVPDIDRDPRIAGWMDWLRDLGIRSYTALPLSTPSRNLGSIGLGKKVPEALHREDLKFLSRIAKLAALVLEKDRATRDLEEQQSLVAISRELSSSLSLDSLLPVILSSLRGIARYERTILSLLDEEGTELHRYGHAQEWEPFVNNGTTIATEQSLSARAIQTRGVAFLTADELRETNDPLAQAMFALGVRTVCSVPLIAGNRIWGTLNPSSIKENVFGVREIEYLQQVANQIGAALQNAHAYREIALLKDRLTEEKRYLEYEIRSKNRSEDIVGKSGALQRVLDYAAIVADTDSTVLITGETGTGKECIARAIHRMSRRADRNFIKVNCAAIPTGLLESELFGHEKGAFTGAVSQKVGRLELADKGTLLLDEVGEIPLELQPKLLRVLQDREFERLGGTKTIRVDVRLVASTNRDLMQAVAEKEFREDLFYRLHVFPLHLPALRDRAEDIPMLISHFVEKCSARLHKRIDIVAPEAIAAMREWAWPGNIRELENFIERSVILSTDNRLSAPLDELREMVRPMSESEGTLYEREREHIIDILRQTRGVLSGPRGAAARLGLKRTTLQYKMQRFGIVRTDYLR